MRPGQGRRLTRRIPGHLPRVGNEAIDGEGFITQGDPEGIVDVTCHPNEVGLGPLALGGDPMVLSGQRILEAGGEDSMNNPGSKKINRKASTIAVGAFLVIFGAPGGIRTHSQ